MALKRGPEAIKFIEDFRHKLYLINRENSQFSMKILNSAIPKSSPATIMNEQKCPLKCPLSARTYDSSGLVRHLKSIHSGTKFGCYLCERSFADLNILFMHLKQHGVLPDKSKIKLFKTSTTGVNDMLGFLNGQVKIYCNEKSPLVKNISERIEDKDSSSAPPRPKKNKNTSCNLQQTSKGERKKNSKYRSYINCCVIGCGTRSTDESKPSFFRFPARNKEQREAWISIVGCKNAAMSDWVPRNSDRICSHHFENGKYSTRRDKVNYIPTLNVGLSNWKPTFNFQPLEPNFSDLDVEETEKEPEMVKEPDEQIPEASRIDLVKNISKGLSLFSYKDSSSDLSRPKMNENPTHILRQTAKVELYCKEKSSDGQIPNDHSYTLQNPEAPTIDLVKTVGETLSQALGETKDSSPSALPRPKKNKTMPYDLQQTSKGGKKKNSKYHSHINCCVIGCGTRSTGESKPSFFRFPARNREQREAWLSIVGHKNSQKNWVPRNSDRICSHHFENGKYSTRRDRVNYIPTLNVGLSNWQPTFNFQPLELNLSNSDEEEMEIEPAMVEEPATKEIDIQCDLWQEFVEEKVFTFECQFIGISEKGTQLTTSRPTDKKVKFYFQTIMIGVAKSCWKCSKNQETS